MENTDELKRAARDAIGKADAEKDWKIVPTEHAKMFEKKAPPLADVLRGARPEGLAEMYEELNEKAVKARDNFKNTVTKANYAVFCTGGLGALLLVAGGLQELLAPIGPWVVGIIGLLGVFSGGLATMWLSQVRGGSLADKWAQERARAEAKRLAYFKAVLDGASDKLFDQLLALEYTRRFLLDNQIDYFRDRGSQHEQAAEIALKASTQAVFVASTLTIIAGLLSWLEPQLAAIAGLGVVASAYSTLAVSRSAVNLDRRNADRYRFALDQLKEQKLEIDKYREKTASGNKGAAQEFFKPVFVTLATDHKGFLDDAEKREMEISAIEERLSVAKDALGKKPIGDAGPS